MKDNNIKDLFNTIISDIPLSSDEMVYGISFIGPPGIGKSTVSQLLSERLKIVITANDKIRRTLDNIGINAKENQPLVERLAYDRTTYLLKNNTSMIIDANVLTAYSKVEENFNRFDAPCFFIKLICSEKEILRRIDEREIQFGKNENNYSRATRVDYDKYVYTLKLHPFPAEKVFFTIDTEKDLIPQIEMLFEKINSYLNSAHV